MPELPFPRGARDLLPNAALFRNELLRKVESVYQRFGFVPIETPVFESLEILRAKEGIGEESKRIYELKEENLGLRYDHTVSLARYYAMHSDLPLPFKRYYIGKVWRLDEPQRNRYRELTQADIDVLGGDPVHSDAESIAASARVLESIGIEYEIRLNSRRFMDSVLESLSVEKGLNVKVYRAVDKADKIGASGVSEQLSALGLSGSQSSKIVSLIGSDASNEEKLSYLKDIGTKEGELSEFRRLLLELGNYSLRGTVRVDLSLVRGLDYYTSTILEVMSKGMNVSIGGGGRYDNLVGLYSSKGVPACGVSLGIDRVMNLLGYESSLQYSYSRVIVLHISERNFPYALNVANTLRSNGINTDINLAQRNLANQLSYANSMRVPYAVIIGDEEEKLGKLKLRNLVDGSEEMLGMEEAVDKLKGK